MEAKTFDHGIHPRYNKDLSKDKALKEAAVPDEVVISLQQHIGAPAKPIVEVGDTVDFGEKIAEAAGFVSANVHASVSGEVVAIEDMAIRIKNDGEDRLAEGIESQGEIEDLSVEELREIVGEAGIVGLGGATFPTHVKVSIPDDKNVEAVILNGAECEPYLTVDHRTMVELTEEMIYGLKAIMKMCEAEKGYIGIEVNKPDAIKRTEELIADEPNIEVVPLEVKYPQGGEKQLIDAVLGKEVPSGGLPLDVGVVVNNVSTAVVIAEAIREGRPLVGRGVTITGDVKEPQNLVVRIGTPIEEILEACGGFKGEPGKVILGGPMMGQAQVDLTAPVTKGTSGILVLSKAEVAQYQEAKPCIRCARCVDVCPVKLIPTALMNLTKGDKVLKLQDYNVLDCIECGSCSYTCPSKIEILDWIKLGKGKVQAHIRENE
ncbi:electron transport complex subunit RsxC [Natroniella sulfidigena]|uniref:electron transport complex subunit RsxC n=1 Tax=Natroniella sulfidigena TaxID=723921 RepID=UPI00200B8D3A|nr:electron transport complex subunit RsxC [Natroniella sulfidigena]MCK8815853.1 electron transport complex subunit RsxC [Natroniella sulfidigena]